MRRRTLLAALGGATVGSAGCSAIVSGPPSAPATDSHTPTPNAPLTADDISFERSIVHTVTDEHPARIRASVANEWHRPFGITHGFTFLSDYRGEHDDGPAQMALYPPGPEPVEISPGPDGSRDRGTPTTPSNGCWRLDATFPVPDLLRVYDLEPGESRDQDLVVYAHHTNADCLPPGAYRFSGELSVSGPTSEQYPKSDVREFELDVEFAVVVDEEGMVARIDDEVTVR